MVIPAPARTFSPEEAMNTAMLMVAFVVTPSQGEKAVTPAEKHAFEKLLAELPHQGEFYTDEAIERAAPYTRVLLALTQKDVGKRAHYGLFAVSRGLLNRKEQREYGVKHFGTIAHPDLKLFWGVILFEETRPSPEIVRFLRAALESEDQAETLSKILGPKFEEFKQRVKDYTFKEV
jgi:hypothetical protein